MSGAQAPRDPAAAVAALARRLRQELAKRPPASLSHSAMLDLASRVSGSEHWHQAKARADRAACDPAAQRGGLAGALPWARVSLRGMGLPSDQSALSEGPQGLRYDAFAPSALPALGEALRRLVCAEGPEPGWSSSGWSARAGGLFNAVWPALEEGAGRGLWALDAARLRSAATWEGVTELRSGPGAAQGEGARVALRQWAKPWHSSFAAPDSAHASFQAVEARWASALDWLDGLARREGLEWSAARRLDPLHLAVEASPRCLALASALLDAEARAPGAVIQGARFELPPEGLDQRALERAALWFSPAPLDSPVRLRSRRPRAD